MHSSCIDGVGHVWGRQGLSVDAGVRDCHEEGCKVACIALMGTGLNVRCHVAADCQTFGGAGPPGCVCLSATSIRFLRTQEDGGTPSCNQIHYVTTTRCAHEGGHHAALRQLTTAGLARIHNNVIMGGRKGVWGLYGARQQSILVISWGTPSNGWGNPPKNFNGSEIPPMNG
jgi:hypothetical protein